MAIRNEFNANPLIAAIAMDKARRNFEEARQLLQDAGFPASEAAVIWRECKPSDGAFGAAQRFLDRARKEFDAMAEGWEAHDRAARGAE